MRKGTFWNIVWGLMFIAAAGLIVLNLLGMLGELSIWTLIISLPLAIGAIASAVNMIWGGMFILLAALTYVYRGYVESALGIELNFWVLIGIAALLSIGFHILFKSKKYRWYKYTGDGVKLGINKIIGGEENDYSNVHSVEEADGEKLYFSEKFSGASKYIKSENLSFVRIENSFGGMDVYFENAKLSPDGALVEIDNQFGGLELYIPRTWNIINNLSNVFAGSDSPKPAWIDGAPTITLRGNNKFGGVEIKLV